jgi:(1->4)-alpha-D-glucan 1-alpha-D-glucosylmutase
MQIPRATYRFQFNEHFHLADALALVPYLHELGVSHIYASPLFKAAPHSVHGYDVCDFNQINPEIGTESDLENLVNALHAKKMGLVLDIVPNHMGISSPENFWWWDVLKNGRESRFANHFDIHWETSDPNLRGKILVPILADHYEKILARGELKLGSARASRASVGALPTEIVLRYFDNQFPLAPNSIPLNFSAEKINSNPAALDELIEKQNYRLAFWRNGDSKLNYRRFFAINTLAGVRVEDEKVFNDVQSLLKKWIGRGWLDGLRVDHPDGLRDPENYLRRLRKLAPDFWIVVEKILQPRENLPETWPVQGTTGYDFLNQVNGLLIQSKNEKILTDFYSEFTGEPTNPTEVVQEKKRLVLQTIFTTEVNRLAELLVQIVARHSVLKNFVREQIREALIEFAASFPVYRTYIRPAENFVGENDSQFIGQAITTAKKLRGDLPPELFDFLSGLLLLKFHGELENDFVARFQQLTSPAMAKGVEDTAFYCLNRFASINEVGGDPGKFGVSAEEFHEFCGRLQIHWPRTMLASSTHDTKRSEDVRARMNLLSEIPGEWREAVLRWSKMNGWHRKNNFPDRNMEYLFYQTLVGAWPVSPERILGFMEKAAHEAKQQTDWNNRNPEYESALKHFVTATMTDADFTDDLQKFVVPLVEGGHVNSLAQTLIKLNAPGAPDIYQGNELWDFSLVDPDNRRLIDFELRKKLPAEMKNLYAGEIWKRRAEGLPKLWLIQKTLKLRERFPDFFGFNYKPVFARGEKSENIIAFSRGEKIITIIPRFLLELNNDWQNTSLELPRGNWQNEFTAENFNGKVRMENLFQQFPVALLVRKEDL